MRPPASDYVTLAEVLELTRPFEEFEAAAQAMARRLEAEGIQELVMLQLHARPGSTEVGVVLVFSDRRRVMQHIQMISGWDEFKQFAGTIKLTHMRVYGKLSPEAEAWVRQFNSSNAITQFDTHVAGFVR
jgi:hypothetical protein